MDIQGLLKTGFSVLLAGLLLSGCASKPVLVSKSATVPPGVDFSGRWQLRSESSEPVNGTSREHADMDIPVRESRRRRSRRAPDSSIHIFIETGSSLKISQTNHGLFISFDRSIVEEFTFGENRVVSVGPIKAQRVAGWEDRVFVVETMDESGAVLSDTWELADGGDVLLRETAILKGGRVEFAVQQYFERT